MADLTVRIRDEFVALGSAINWPMHFAIPAFDANLPQIQVQVSTDHVSPLAVDNYCLAVRFPHCNALRVWFALRSLRCDRMAVVRRALTVPCDRPSQMRWSERAIEEALEKSRQRGYSTFVLPARHTNLIGLAVAICLAGRVVGAVSVRFAESAVPVREAETRFLPLLRALAARAF